jgi:hypothetical protein
VVQVIEGAVTGEAYTLKFFFVVKMMAWKIYRVRDVTNNHEHPIFNTGAIAREKAAAESGL